MTHINRRDVLSLIGAAAVACGASPIWAGTDPMLTRRIPSSGEVLPIIGLGTWQTFDVGASPAERAPLEEVLRAFVALGGRVIDSSPMYGRSEEVVGEMASTLGVHEALFLATKVWTSGRQEGIEQMEDSMRKLRARRIDLMQVHNLVDARTHLQTLRAWKREGRVRYLGITHYDSRAYEAVEALLRREALDFVQINYSIGEREAERRLLPLAADRGVAVIANRPFAGGDLFRRLRGRPLPSWAADIGCQSWAQILLKFVVSHPAITCTIPATSRLSHLRDNMQGGYGRMPDTPLRARIAAEIA